MLPLIPLVAFLVGLLVYVLATNAKAAEVGRCLLWTGALATLLIVGAQHVVSLH